MWQAGTCHELHLQGGQLLLLLLMLLLLLLLRATPWRPALLPLVLLQDL
jgi:hypothetical protein